LAGNLDYRLEQQQSMKQVNEISKVFWLKMLHHLFMIVLQELKNIGVSLMDTDEFIA
jgi:hypothetical protein